MSLNTVILLRGKKYPYGFTQRKRLYLFFAKSDTSIITTLSILKNNTYKITYDQGGVAPSRHKFLVRFVDKS